MWERLWGELSTMIYDCQEFINVLYDTLSDMVDKLSDIFTQVYTAHSGAYYEDEHYLWLRLESEKKIKEHLARKYFEMQMRHTKINKGYKTIQMNRKFSPRSWTGKNFKRMV